MSDKLVPLLEKQPGVRMAIGTVVQPLEGFDTTTGLDLYQFSRMSGGFHFLEGGPFQKDDDILVDEFYARQKHIHTGDTMDLIGHAIILLHGPKQIRALMKVCSSFVVLL